MIYRINQYYSRLVLLYVVLAVLHLQVYSGSGLVFASDDQSCETQLDQAEESYYGGNLELAIALIRQCLDDTSISRTVRVRAYTILAKTYIAKEEPENAKDAMRKILEIEPSYLPTIEQESPRYVNLAAEVREEQAFLQLESKETGISPWVWIGAGSAAAAAAVVIVLVASGSAGGEPGSSSNALPAPPDLP
jgi:tetratricopeptide (TPR) repeat protein